MAGWTIRGPRYQQRNQCDVQDGTLPRTASARPGPIRSVEPFPGCEDQVSIELIEACGLGDVVHDLPPLTPAQMKVLAWLRLHQSEIIQAETEWGVDRRAVAGAIAWEALNNVKTGLHWYNRFVGAGKVHYYDRDTLLGVQIPITRLVTVAEEVENEGYLPQQEEDERKKVLAKPSGSIGYIAAIMRAFADVLARYRYLDIYWSPAMLANLYNGWDLRKARAHFEKKQQAENQSRVKHTSELQLGNAMGHWVNDNLDYLEAAVGAPDTSRPPPALVRDTARGCKVIVPPTGAGS